MFAKRWNIFKKSKNLKHLLEIESFSNEWNNTERLKYFQKVDTFSIKWNISEWMTHFKKVETFLKDYNLSKIFKHFQLDNCEFLPISFELKIFHARIRISSTRKSGQWTSSQTFSIWKIFYWKIKLRSEITLHYCVSKTDWCNCEISFAIRKSSLLNLLLTPLIIPNLILVKNKLHFELQCQTKQ